MARTQFGARFHSKGTYVQKCAPQIAQPAKGSLSSLEQATILYRRSSDVPFR